MGKRNPKKKSKFHLVFDEEDRNEFLTGFQKRKQQRKDKAKEKMVKALKEEKARIRKKKHEEKQSTLYLHDTGVPEVDHLIEKVEVIDTESHTITISAMDTAQIAGQLNYSMGPNKGVTKLKKIDSNPKKKGAN